MAENNSKPNFSHSQVSEILKRCYNLTTLEIDSLPSYYDQNFYLVPVEGGQYVLKILNSEDSKNLDLIEVQNFVMSFLQQNGIPAHTVLPSTSGQLVNLEEIDCGYGLQKYVVRLFSYLPGTTITTVPSTPQLLFETGKLAASVDKVLQELKHPKIGVLEKKFIWSLTNLLLLEPYLHLLDGEPLQEVVKSVIQQYKTSVEPQRPGFRKCINHGDISNLNMLVVPDGNDGHRISGVVDFGHTHSGYYIHELAITIMYMMIEHPNPLEVGGPILAGWESVLPLNEAEKDCLYVLVMSRFCQSLVIARHAVLLHPENKEYLMLTSKTGINIITQLWKLGKEQVEKLWFESAAQLKEKRKV